jgi:hypothetical protein
MAAMMAAGVVVDHDDADGAAGGGEGPDISGVQYLTRCF